MTLFSRLTPALAELQSYRPDLKDYAVRLDANEAPAFLSAAARERIAATVADVAWHRYPDPTATRLRGAVAAHMGRQPSEVLLGVGSDELISLLLTAFSAAPPRQPVPTLLTTTPTFVMYRMTARVHGWRVLEVPLDAQWLPNVDGLLKAAEFASPNILFLATPNNPTATRTSLDSLRTLARALPETLLVVDEAYINYADDDHRVLLDEFDNVALLRTLSKVGFASLRLGWLTAPERLITELDKARLPYNICSSTQAIAELALTEFQPEIQSMVELVRSERTRLIAALRALPGVSVPESQANFLWVQVPGEAAAVQRGLGERGVLVRSFASGGGRLENQLRVTVGAPAENERFLTALRETLTAFGP